ncbi:MAG: response regulator [Dehalococcoidales bacterium]|jgi:putative two-component system response regulator|nr:response regulator [Dehalococcoidales bacterium]
MDTGGKATVLIVDDEEALRKVLRKKLLAEGYRCLEAGNAEQALEQLRNNKIDLVTLDVKMPGKSGHELLSEIRAAYPDTAVIMVTAVIETSTAIECMKNGAQDYLCKPFNLDEVILSVNRALEIKRLELEVKKYQQQLEQRVKEQTEEIRKIFLGAIEALIFALEAKDKYTAGHSRAVNKIAMDIGSQLGLSGDELEDLHWGSLLHDVGKIAVDPAIQNKPGKLTPEEYRHVMVHAQIGPRIVSPVVNDKIVEIISHHHDHYDGNGHEQTVSGEEIPLGARILAVADAFDAMTSNRPYRSGMPVSEAKEEIKRYSGSQFDPVVVSAFLEISDTALAEKKRD